MCSTSVPPSSTLTHSLACRVALVLHSAPCFRTELLINLAAWKCWLTRWVIAESLLWNCHQGKAAASPPNQANSPGAATNTVPETCQCGSTKAKSPHLNSGHVWRAFQVSELRVGSAPASAAAVPQSHSPAQSCFPSAHRYLAQSQCPRTCPTLGPSSYSKSWMEK